MGVIIDNIKIFFVFLIAVTVIFQLSGLPQKFGFSSVIEPFLIVGGMLIDAPDIAAMILVLISAVIVADYLTD
jgi:hypothetical protein